MCAGGRGAAQLGCSLCLRRPAPLLARSQEKRGRARPSQRIHCCRVWLWQRELQCIFFTNPFPENNFDARELEAWILFHCVLLKFPTFSTTIALSTSPIRKTSCTFGASLDFNLSYQTIRPQSSSGFPFPIRVLLPLNWGSSASAYSSRGKKFSW